MNYTQVIAEIGYWWRGWSPHLLSHVRTIDAGGWTLIAGFITANLCLAWMWARERGGR